jgi:LmbE family N-acetylglucosaminyl deacetylase
MGYDEPKEWNMKACTGAALLACSLLCGSFQSRLQGQTVETAPPIPKPDDRYKADILLVVAHPDDDTGISNYITRASLDEHKRVSVVFTTRGNSGANAVGMEHAKAMADEREMEARHALAVSGISNVWFLRGSDTPTQDVLHSLETLGHGEALDEVVRIIRLTRPEVVITWMPGYVAGENHGDHQASSVVATEAFDIAGDPAVFPEQVNAPRRNQGISNYGEGLHPWQAKKLYFFSDASHQDFLEHHGPKYLASDLSSSKGVSFAALNKMAWDLYATQTDPQEDYYVHMPDYLILAKSLVKSQLEADVWDGIDHTPIPYAPPPCYQPVQRPPVSLELGGPWAFYQQFYVAHGLTSVMSFLKPQTALSADHRLWVPLLLHNDSDQPRDVILHASLPEGWTPPAKDVLYHLEPRSTYPAQILLTAPATKPDAPPQQLRWSMTDDGKAVGEVALTVYMEFNGVPQ